MDPAKKKGWNREILNKRHAAAASNTDAEVLTDAEFHLTVGRIIRRRLRYGKDIEGYANRVNMTASQCREALDYANSSPGLIFRALVEDWSWERIQREIRNNLR